MTTATLAPGCNMPCISPSPEKHPGLWAYTVEGTDKGLVSALGDEDERRSDDRFQHLVFFPTWSGGEIGFFRLPEGEKVTIDAVNDSTLQVTLADGFQVSYPNMILVVFHGSLDFEAVKAFYAKP
jgi:hypothetical protein